MNSFCTYSRKINILPTITVKIQGQLVFTIDPLFIMPQRTKIIIPQAQCKSNIRVFSVVEVRNCLHTCPEFVF